MKKYTAKIIKVLFCPPSYTLEPVRSVPGFRIPNALRPTFEYATFHPVESGDLPLGITITRQNNGQRVTIIDNRIC